MDVRHCPRCGSDDIETSSGSAEYSHWVRWDCEDCDWAYKDGSGMGTGSRSSGTHPRELSGDQQDTLTPTGEYCTNCEVVVAGDHACTPEAVLEAADADTLPQADVIDALDEWHTTPEKELRESLGDRVALTPTFFHVTLVDADDEPAMFDELVDEVERAIDEQEVDEDDRYDHADCVKLPVVKDRLAAQDGIESAYIDYCVRKLKRRGRVRHSLDGLSLPE